MLKAVLVLIPFIVDMVKEGKIKTATEKEVLDAFEQKFEELWAKRITDARIAGDNVSSLPDPADPFDRANKSSNS